MAKAHGCVLGIPCKWTIPSERGRHVSLAHALGVETAQAPGKSQGGEDILSPRCAPQERPPSSFLKHPLKDGPQLLCTRSPSEMLRKSVTHF